MGIRASQLKNRQQVQDSSAVITNGDSLSNSAADIKAIQNTNDSNGNLNNNNTIEDDVTLIKEAIHAAAHGNQQQGNGDTQQQSNDVQQANEGASVAPKVSTLYRQASHIQSLAQRIRRSSSVRRFIPSFVNGKRKVSIPLPSLAIFFRSSSTKLLCVRGSREVKDRPPRVTFTLSMSGANFQFRGRLPTFPPNLLRPKYSLFSMLDIYNARIVVAGDVVYQLSIPAYILP